MLVAELSIRCSESTLEEHTPRQEGARIKCYLLKSPGKNLENERTEDKTS